ncbi:MAG: sigma-70 family RNA polymerase sigma factor [Lentisphaeria bacterium]|nr:sigma-70 family RNA polymerase sigma factor [Lentisphaeria bacterium]NQZ67488.1 sigma-70 family RNA polymerase sigma factor [Lentisphaeria bacterium]
MTETIYEEHRLELINFINQKIGNFSDAEDLLHDTFKKMIVNAETLDESRVRSWLFHVARNAIVDYYRKKKSFVELSDLLEDESYTEPERDGLKRCIQGMMLELPEADRLALIESDLERIPQKEIAARLNISHTAVKSRIQRSRKRLHEMVNDCCVIERDSLGRVMQQECKSSCGCSD